MVHRLKGEREKETVKKKQESRGAPGGASFEAGADPEGVKDCRCSPLHLLRSRRGGPCPVKKEKRGEEAGGLRAAPARRPVVGRRPVPDPGAAAKASRGGS